MDCRKYESQFNDYLDGELSSRDREALQSHLKECLTCYRKWSSLQKTHEILHQLPTFNPPKHLIAVVMARLKNRRLRERSWFFANFPRWLPLGVGVAAVLLISFTLWQVLPSPLSWRSLTSGSHDNILDATESSVQPSAKFTIRKRNSSTSVPVMVLRVKDFSRADQELESMLRSFNRPVLPEKESIRSLRSSSARLIDVKVPGQRFPHLLRELDKIGHLDRSQVESHKLADPQQQKAISIRIVVITNGSDMEIRRLRE